jgi:hypothetical protein
MGDRELQLTHIELFLIITNLDPYCYCYGASAQGDPCTATISNLLFVFISVLTILFKPPDLSDNNQQIYRVAKQKKLGEK